MYGKTHPRMERKILAIFWSIAFFFGVLTVCHIRSVHVTSVRRKTEDDRAIVFLVEVANPTNDQVSACIRLAASTGPNCSAAPWGSIEHDRKVVIPAGQTVVAEFRFNRSQSRFFGGAYSASVVTVETSNDSPG